MLSNIFYDQLYIVIFYENTKTFANKIYHIYSMEVLQTKYPRKWGGLDQTHISIKVGWEWNCWEHKKLKDSQIVLILWCIFAPNLKLKDN